MVPGLGKLGTPWFWFELLETRIRERDSAIEERQASGEVRDTELKEEVGRINRVLGMRQEWGEIDFVTRMRGGGLVSRPEAAAMLRISQRQVQRMETAGKLRRCPNLGSAVRYAASDVLKLASARPWKED